MLKARKCFSSLCEVSSCMACFSIMCCDRSMCCVLLYFCVICVVACFYFDVVAAGVIYTRRLEIFKKKK
jgi:hypothetical protein